MQRINQYGESLIGPPTYAEWLSRELGDLLLHEGEYKGDATNLYCDTAELHIRLNDYWNFGHAQYPKGCGENVDREFYEAGHTPILGVTITTKSSDEKRTYALFRPIDSQKGLGHILVQGFTKKQKQINSVVASTQVHSKVKKYPSDRQPLRSHRELQPLTEAYLYLTGKIQKANNEYPQGRTLYRS